jgi:hypothetical protein
MQPAIYEKLNTGSRVRGVRAGVTYGVLLLALCLMIVDFCRLIRAPGFRY